MLKSLRTFGVLVLCLGASLDCAFGANYEIRGATLETTLRKIWNDGTVEMQPASPGEDASKARVHVQVRGIERDRLLEVLLAAVEMEGNHVGDVLWVHPTGMDDAKRLTLRDLDGFEIFKIGDRDILKEVQQREEERLDPLTRAYLQHRRSHKKPRSGDDVRGGNSYLGVRLAVAGSNAVPDHATEELREIVEKWDGWGALILEVVPETPSAYSGLVAGDIVVKFAGLWVESRSTLVRMASRAEVGREIEIEVLRDGTVRREYIVIGERPKRTPAAP